MNLILIVIAAIVVGGALIALSIWLNKKGITKDDNDNYIPDVLEDKVKNVKNKVKEVKNIVKKKK
jgi:anaerobic C4-dicarboxylate transporter|tara:strand:- start:1131 stop:1325 length:195 start_codon:yes stop_codon:yes gene_type:complete